MSRRGSGRAGTRPVPAQADGRSRGGAASSAGLAAALQAEKLEAIGQLSAGIAHEINTPVQFIGDNVTFLSEAFASFLQLLDAYRRALPQGALAEAEEAADAAYLTQEVPRALAETLEGVARVATVVRALKDFARPDDREQTPTDLNRALQSTLTIAQSEIKHVARVETHLGELPPVYCHAGDVNQVFLNLLVNAAHAIADRYAASGALGTIVVESSVDGDGVVIRIADDGCGMPEHVRARIFEPFFTTKGVGRGSGQGLAIAWSVAVERHGGALTCESEEGRGTVFTLRLPVDGMPRRRKGSALS